MFWLNSLNSLGYISIFTILLVFLIITTLDLESEAIDLFKIDGKIEVVTTTLPQEKDWISNTRMLVDGGDYLAYLRSDGSCAVNGTYVRAEANPDYIFETSSVYKTSKGTMHYPLEFSERRRANYFQRREQWQISDFLMNPMILIMVLLIMVLMDAANQDAQKKMSKPKSSGAKTGENWTYRMYFDPEADKPKNDIPSVMDEELMTSLLIDLVGDDEDILNVSSYNCPLSKLQCTMLLKIFYHMFIIFETAIGYYSIEKNSEGITFQKSGKESYVKYKYRQGDRVQHVTQMKYDQGRKSVYDVIKWLYTKNELNKEYNYLTSNCKHFANAVFNHVIQYPRLMDGEIYFDPRADKSQDDFPSLTYEEFMNKVVGIDDVHEDIIRVSMYKYHPSSDLWTKAYYHKFIFIETASWYWSIDKKAEGYTIQRSKNRIDVADKYRREYRDQNIVLVKTDEGKGSVLDLIKWLYEEIYVEIELKEKYPPKEFCPQFAYDVFDYVAKNNS